MKFYVSFCDPFQKEIVEMGAFVKDDVIPEFESISWADYLSRIQTAPREDIHYSPSFEVENTKTKHSLTVSAVGDANAYEFYIFYKRPKEVKSFLGFTSKTVPDYTTDITGQSKQDVLDCLNAFVKNDMQFLVKKIGD
jgi:hypothetical protein